VQPFADKAVGGTSGAKRICDDKDQMSKSEGLYWKYESWIKKNESRLNTCTASAGEIFAMRKVLFKDPQEFIINDDFYLLLSILKQGFKVIYVPEAKSWERISADQKGEIIRRKRINAGRYQALFNGIEWLPWKKPVAIWQIFSHKFLRLFSPFLMILALLSNAWLVFEGYPNAGYDNIQKGLLLFFLSQLGFYLLALLNPVIPQFSGGKALHFPAFLVNSNLAALQGFVSFINGSQSVLWERVKRRNDG
jgi:cellulose synthase/poly-beta-1,6-N-acetylglucosamine synthase-like glycosyltransferase